jgi:hypothetical protein
MVCWPLAGGGVWLVLHRVPGDFHEGLLQRCLACHQLMQGDAVPSGQVPDRRGAGAADRQAVLVPGFDHRAMVAQQPGQAIAVGERTWTQSPELWRTNCSTLVSAMSRRRPITIR